jgi:Holliday junction resolvase RusA-like endonuclease
VNEIWARTPHGMRLTEKGKAFKNRCTSIVRELLLRIRQMRALPRDVGWRLMVVFWLPRLETAQWTETGKGRRFTNRDVDNLEKLTLDGVFGALGENDSSVIGLTTDKKDGQGEGRLDFMLKEEAVPLEEPNTTELADEINSRGGAVRVSPTDPPAFLFHCKTHQPASGEYRYTHFDEWRLAIMDTVLSRFDQMQGTLSCPARSGQIDSCFECTDFMVVYCLLNNPVALNDKGVRTGLFDLCQQRVGTHISLVDRPSGGERMEQKTNPKTPSAHFLEVLGLLGRVGQDVRLLNNATTAIFTMLSSPDVKKDDQPGQEACTKLAVVLAGLIEAGAGRPLPRSVIYYREVTLSSMPDDIRNRITKVGNAYKLCVALYGEYRRLYMEWLNGQPAEPVAPTQPAAEEAKPEEAAAPAGQAAEAPPAEAPPAEEPAAPPAEEKPRGRRTRKEMAQAAAAEPEAPPVTQDASVDVQPDGDTPQVHPIPPDEAPPAEAPPEEPVIGARPETVTPKTSLTIVARLDRLEKLVAKLATKDDILAQMKRLEPIAPAFNQLREYLLSLAKKE